MGEDQSRMENSHEATGSDAPEKQAAETAALLQAVDRWAQGLLSQGYTVITDEGLWVFARYARTNKLKGFGSLTIDSTDYHIRIWTGDGDRPILVQDLYGSKAFIPPGPQLAFWLSLKDFVLEKVYMYGPTLQDLKREITPPSEAQPHVVQLSLSIETLGKWPVAVRPILRAWSDGWRVSGNEITGTHFAKVASTAVVTLLCGVVRQALIKQVGLTNPLITHEGYFVLGVSLSLPDNDKFYEACLGSPLKS